MSRMPATAEAALGATLFAALISVAAAQDAVGVERLTGTLAKVAAAKAIALGYRDESIPFSYLGP